MEFHRQSLDRIYIKLFEKLVSSLTPNIQQQENYGTKLVHHFDLGLPEKTQTSYRVHIQQCLLLG